MRIDRIRIDGFGIWNDRTWETLSPGLNIFHGPNETGKSTMMSFIRSVFFGLDRRGHARRYEPLRGGTHGGWLDVHVKGRSIRIERKAGRHVRGVVAVYDGEKTGGDAELEALLAGTTRTLYHNVFAFGLDELQQFEALQDTEIAQHISGAALGIGAARWSAVSRDLEARQSALFLPRGVNGAINVALRELEAVRDDLDRTEHQPEEYWTAHQSRVQLAAEIAGLEDILADLKQRAAHYDRRLKARPLMERRRTLIAKLEALPAVDHFPEGGIERLEMLKRRLQTLQNEQVQLTGELDQRGRRRAELGGMADFAERERRVRILDLLRKLVPRMEASRRIYDAALEQQRIAAEERLVIELAMNKVRPPSPAGLLAFLGLIAIGAAAFYLLGNAYVAGSLVALLAAPLLWYWRREAVFSAMTQQFHACSVRLEACDGEVQKVENEARIIAGELRKLTGKTDISQEEVEARAIEVEKFVKAGEEMARLDEVIERVRVEMARVAHEMREGQQAMEALLAEARASDIPTFIEHSEIYRQRQQLRAEIEKLPEEVPETALLFDIRVNEEEALNTVRAEIADIEQRLAGARHESGRVDERISSMERSEERSRALARQEVVMAKIDASSEMWAVVTLCRALLEETRKVYENDRQPQVLRYASRFFSTMTEERYVRVIAPLDGADIQVERADGVRLPPELLSRGTAEQLYLAMRFALVRDYASHVDALPVVFDDVFVNFDPGRTRNTLKAVADLAQSHQVLLFTCHPHIVSLADEIVPATKIFPLQ